MRTTSKFKVGAHEYQVNMWHPDKAIENLTWLTKVAGEPILAVIVNVGSLADLMESDVDLTLLMPAVKELITNLHEDQVVYKVNTFVEEMQCDGKDVVYATHFLGRPGHLMKVLAQVLKAQYADFFDELPAGLRKPSEATGSKTSPDLTPAH